MRIRLIDYVGNAGGGVRFAVEMLRALTADPSLDLEVLSHGAALARYRSLMGPQVKYLELPPANRWRAEPFRLLGLPGEGMIGRLFGSGASFHFDVPPSAFEGCDLVWLPWIHRHRIPAAGSARAVASLHDLIMIQFKEHLPSSIWRDEFETLQGWLRSSARVVVSSQTTAAALHRTFGTPQSRVEVVPLSEEHRTHPSERALHLEAAALQANSYLLYPANTFVHKNHEVLLEGYAAWRGNRPLVLTGDGSELKGWGGRAALLRRKARSLGLAFGERLFALGYVADAEYSYLLRRAWALVMPSLAEGGGSFPVLDALREGVPVVCSDIPVMREMMERVGGEALWFDPGSPADLTARLRELERDQELWKRRAMDQRTRLRGRSWLAVAVDYRAVFDSVLRSLPTGSA